MKVQNFTTQVLLISLTIITIYLIQDKAEGFDKICILLYFCQPLAKSSPPVIFIHI